jgi:hypothetical protein
VGKRGGDRRHAALERGNPMNLRIGCGTQQAREPASGGSRRGREKRRGRNERGTGRCRADAGESPREWTPAGLPMERRSLRNPMEGAWLCTSRAAVRCVSDSGYASTQRAVRTSVHIARSRGKTTRFCVRSRTDPTRSVSGKATRPGTLRCEVVPQPGHSTATGEKRSEACRDWFPAHRASP